MSYWDPVLVCLGGILGLHTKECMREFLGFGPSLMVWEGSQCSIPAGVSELLGTSPSVVWKGSWGSIPRRVCVNSWDPVLVVGV